MRLPCIQLCPEGLSYRGLVWQWTCCCPMDGLVAVTCMHAFGSGLAEGTTWARREPQMKWTLLYLSPAISPWCLTHTMRYQSGRTFLHDAVRPHGRFGSAVAPFPARCGATSARVHKDTIVDQLGSCCPLRLLLSLSQPSVLPPFRFPASGADWSVQHGGFSRDVDIGESTIIRRPGTNASLATGYAASSPFDVDEDGDIAIGATVV